MTVRVYTDASIKNNRGSWAAVIIRPPDRKVELSGALRGHFASSTAVELAAIANAIHVIRAKGIAAGGDDVVVLTDNLNAANRINGACRVKNRKGKAIDPVIIRAALVALTTASGGGFTLRAEWVKGHQRLDSTCPHAPLNRRADKLATDARKAMEQAAEAKRRKRK